MNLRRIKDGMEYGCSIINGTASLVIPITGQIVRTLGSMGAISADISDGMVVVASSDGSVILYGVDGSVIRRLSINNATAVSFSGSNILCSLKTGGSVLISPMDQVIRVF